MVDITLPNGDALTLRDPETISERARRAVEAAYTMMSDEMYAELQAARAESREVKRSRATAHDLEFLNRVNDTATVALISAWSRADVAVPITEESLLDLDAPSYASLITQAAPLILELRLDFSPTPAGVESPTEPVSA